MDTCGSVCRPCPIDHFARIRIFCDQSGEHRPGIPSTGHVSRQSGTAVPTKQFTLVLNQQAGPSTLMPNTDYRSRENGWRWTGSSLSEKDLGGTVPNVRRRLGGG